MMPETMYKGNRVVLTGLAILFFSLLGCDEPLPSAPEKMPPKIVSKKILKSTAPQESIAKAKNSDGGKMAEDISSGVPDRSELQSSGTPQAGSTIGDKTEIAPQKVPAGETAPVDENLVKREKQLAESMQPVSAEDMPLDDSIAKIEPYDFKGRIDPFIPLLSEPDETSKEKEEKPARLLTPLEKMELSQIKLVAVIQMQGRSIAMVEEASGKGYEVRLGTYMGRNGGQVTAINANSIIVKEYVKDFKGKSREQFQEIKFNNDEGGE
ncbi:MAG TPA: hypothetical protein DHV36_10130 [Desulfobacteraceae bacterium]|nr:hypothetical protein [Desulfobacteraceae bacterium]